MKFRDILIFIFLFFILGNLIYDSIILGPKSTIAEENLQQESNNFNALGAILISSKTYKKNQSVSIVNTYTTNQGWDEISTLYLKEAAKNGWIFIRNEENKKLFQKGNDFNLYIYGKDKEINIELHWRGKKALNEYFK